VLNTGTCHWEQLSADEWAICKVEYKARVDTGMVDQRTPHKDKGISRKGKQPTSNEIINDGSDEGSGEGSGEGSNDESNEENVDTAVMA